MRAFQLQPVVSGLLSPQHYLKLFNGPIFGDLFLDSRVERAYVE